MFLFHSILACLLAYYRVLSICTLSCSRGTKVQLANPHYKSPGAQGEDDSDIEESSVLPVEHPDYSPPPTFAPKLLFPEARVRDPARPRGRHQTLVEATDETTRSEDTSRKSKPATEKHAESSPRSRPVSSASNGSDEILPSKPGVKSTPDDVEAAMEAALAQRLARRLANSRAVVGGDSAPQTRTRARGAPRLPERDSDLARRAMGPVRAADDQRHSN